MGEDHEAGRSERSSSRASAPEFARGPLSAAAACGRTSQPSGHGQLELGVFFRETSLSSRKLSECSSEQDVGMVLLVRNRTLRVCIFSSLP